MNLPLIHSFKDFDRYYVFDANSNSIFAITEREWQIANDIERGVITEEGEVLIDKFRKRNLFNTPIINKIKHPETDALPYHLGRKIQKLTLQVTQECNLRCDYCVYSGSYRSRSHSQKRMSLEVAKKAIDYVFEHSVDEEFINIGFYGGEPLLELPLIEACILHAHTICGDKNVSFSLTTNGTLLTVETYERLVKHNGMHISVSLDGPKRVHDKSRKYTDGRGSFDDIMKNLHDIYIKHPEAKEKINFLAVISPNLDKSCYEPLYQMEDILPYFGVNISYVDTIYSESVIEYKEEFSSYYVQEQTKVILYMLGKIDKRKVSRLLYDSFNNTLLKYERLRQIKEIPEVCHPGGPCIAGVHRLFLSADGVYYPCERVSEISEPMKIGNINEGIDVEKANVILNIGILTEAECKKCWAILHCTMCAAHADELTFLSREKRLSGCDAVKAQVEDIFKDICFLKFMGFDFDAKTEEVE